MGSVIEAAVGVSAEQRRGPAAVTVSGLRVGYRRNAAPTLSGVDLTVRQGESVALVGTNGAGKSTLLRCLVRLVEPSAGTIRLGDVDVTAASRRTLRAVRRDVGFVFQRFHLVGRLSAFDNVVHGAMGRRGLRCAWPLLAVQEVRDEALQALERVGLADLADRRVESLSGGQQQRVAIARMLMQRPRLILADEPVASLDPASAISAMDLLRSIAADSGVTVIMAMHHVDLALRYSDRIVGLRGGAIELDQPSGSCDPAQLNAVYAASAS
ncbi:phosphonate ABC transporter ATP-binding protein [Mycolicibacterium sp.]|uniref:phosphonate ABC transporter ATP-binding protein n=1 Tax=Mycolicibacterium sp. TaxID=2320850 RepID=UPI00355D8EBF